MQPAWASGVAILFFVSVSAFVYASVPVLPGLFGSFSILGVPAMSATLLRYLRSFRSSNFGASPGPDFPRRGTMRWLWSAGSSDDANYGYSRYWVGAYLRGLQSRLVDFG